MFKSNGANHSLQALNKFMAWSMQQLFSGSWPATDHDGHDFGVVSRTQLATELRRSMVGNPVAPRTPRRHFQSNTFSSEALLLQSHRNA